MRDHYISLRSRDSMNKKKPVRKGDLIISSEPFAHIISDHHSSSYCDYCFVPQEKKLVRPCKGCRVPWYCSEDCIRLGWDIHQYECHRLQRMAPYVPASFVRLLARIIFRLQSGGDKIIEKCNSKEGRRFRDLMNHYYDVKNDKNSQKDVEDLIAELRKYIGEDNMPNESDFLGIYGRVLVNRFCIFDDTMLTFGSGVFLAASIFDHACLPNCYVSFVGRRVHIRSLVDMEELNFDKCRISYIDPVASVLARMEDLRQKWYFSCDCKTCADKERGELESSILCDRCSTAVYVPEAYSHKIPSIVCPGCQEPLDKERIRLYRQIVIFTKYHLNRLSEESPNLTDCLEILEHQGEVLHSMNVWRVRTLDYTFNAAIHNGCFSLALDYGDRNYEGMRYYYGETHPTFALFLFKYGKANIYLKEFREGVNILEKAEPILKMGLGPHHPVVVDQLIPTSLLANEDLEICLERRMKAMKKEQYSDKRDKIESKDGQKKKPISKAA